MQTTPDTSLPPLNPTENRRKMLIEIEVGADFEKRLDNQWEVEREIHADRWSWKWKNVEDSLPIADEVEETLNWQDISTAPKDGAVVLICNAADYPCSVEAAVFHLNSWWHGESQQYKGMPTHWQPLLPQPPAARAQPEDGK